MTLDRFPRSARGNPHGLVVIPCRATRREGIAEPEIILVGRDAVGDVGECRRTLVGCDDEIGIVLVPGHHIVWMDDGITLNIVGDIEQAANECLVGADTFGEPFVAGSRLGQLLGIEPTLGTDRNDDGILDLLSLDQAENLGAEIIAPV